MNLRVFLSLVALGASGCSFNWDELQANGAAQVGGAGGNAAGGGASGSAASGAAGSAAGGGSDGGTSAKGGAGTGGSAGGGNGGSSAGKSGGGAGGGGGAATGGTDAMGGATAAGGTAAGAGGDAAAGGASAGSGGAGGDPGLGGSAGLGGTTAGLGGSSGSGGSSPACAPPSMALGDGCYFLVSQGHPRSGADTACGAKLGGAKLAVFPDKSTQDLVMTGLGAMAPDYWFAIDCAQHDASCNASGPGVWTWLGGGALGYSDWLEDPPNDASGCARLLLAGGQWGWNDAPCNTKYAAVCKAN